MDLTPLALSSWSNSVMLRWFARVGKLDGTCWMEWLKSIEPLSKFISNSSGDWEKRPLFRCFVSKTAKNNRNWSNPLLKFQLRHFATKKSIFVQGVHYDTNPNNCGFPNTCAFVWFSQYVAFNDPWFYHNWISHRPSEPNFTRNLWCKNVHDGWRRMLLDTSVFFGIWASWTLEIHQIPPTQKWLDVFSKNPNDNDFLKVNPPTNKAFFQIKTGVFWVLGWYRKTWWEFV